MRESAIHVIPFSVCDWKILVCLDLRNNSTTLFTIFDFDVLYIYIYIYCSLSVIWGRKMGWQSPASAWKAWPGFFIVWVNQKYDFELDS